MLYLGFSMCWQDFTLLMETYFPSVAGGEGSAVLKIHFEAVTNSSFKYPLNVKRDIILNQ